MSLFFVSMFDSTTTPPMVASRTNSASGVNTDQVHTP